MVGKNGVQKGRSQRKSWEGKRRGLMDGAEKRHERGNSECDIISHWC